MNANNLSVGDVVYIVYDSNGPKPFECREAVVYKVAEWGTDYYDFMFPDGEIVTNYRRSGRKQIVEWFANFKQATDALAMIISNSRENDMRLLKELVSQRDDLSMRISKLSERLKRYG